jgi:hypothetical protein
MLNSRSGANWAPGDKSPDSIRDISLSAIWIYRGTVNVVERLASLVWFKDFLNNKSLPITSGIQILYHIIPSEIIELSP